MPRAIGVAVALGLAVSLTIPPVSGLAGIEAALADEADTPSRQDVRDARTAARDKARDVDAVQADLAAANHRLQQSAIEAAQATEAWNGARYRLEQARQAAAAADERAGIAHTDVDRQQDAYADALVSSYQLAPTLTAVASMVQADGIGTVLEQSTTMRAAESALDSRYDGFVAASTLASVALDQAEAARADAATAQVEAREARDQARVAAEAAAAEADAIAARKGELIEELAELQDISVELAEERQQALDEQRAQAAAAAAAEETAQQAAAQQAAEQAEQAAQEAAQQGDRAEEQQPAAPEPEEPATEPAPPPPQPDPPAPGGGASAAIAFARAQLGEPYVWGAAGPGSWDCSGLTMGAWGAGGKYLPHYSVAQYEQSTPISASSLRAGDLVFWGSSSSPSSIFHVALYVGNSQIIHAPRTGRPVSQESMYYWTTPNFYARP
ncbi:C40 family peptidase [Nocardioides sp.]|uniref:C40 family peptidase n=1 Tax=Nocardioides sp. TaxID=35761 RepID=UPI002ED66DF1